MAQILIIDDDRDILRMMEFTLNRAGHQSITTTSGNQGLEIVQSNPPDLVIADIMMPEMTGYDFTRRVRALPGLAELPILIYSARFQPIDRQTALEAGATAYMPKNVSPPEIIGKVNELLGDGAKQQAVAPGVAVACFSLRGGVGVTSVAVNLAVILALSHKTQVCLADLTPMAGHAGLMLGLRPQTCLSQVLALPDERLTAEGIKQHLMAHKSGVQLLGSPLVPPDTPPQHSLPSLLQTLRTVFQFILLDLPHSLTEAQLELLSHLTRLILVLSPDVPALQSGVAALKYLVKRGLAPENIVPLLNHNTATPGLAAEAIQKTIQRPLAAAIPFDPDMAAAIKAGQPLVLHNPKAPAARALAQLVPKLIQ